MEAQAGVESRCEMRDAGPTTIREKMERIKDNAIRPRVEGDARTRRRQAAEAYIAPIA